MVAMFLRAQSIALVACTLALPGTELRGAGAVIRPPAKSESLSPDAIESKLLADGVDGQFDAHSLLVAALIASGHTSENVRARPEARYREHALKFLRGLNAQDTARDRAAAALAYLQREMLTGKYDARCSDVRQTLETGEYNCVTTTILYLALADEAGLAAHAVHLPAHVRCFVATAGVGDVEPTALPGSAAAIGGPGRKLSSPALIGKIYFNRGVAALEAGDHAAAADLLATSVALDPADGAARHNMLAALNNGAIKLTANNEYGAALRQLERVAALDESYAPLTINRVHVLHRWAEHLLAKGETHAALARIEEGLRHSPNHPALLGLKSQVQFKP